MLASFFFRLEAPTIFNPKIDSQKVGPLDPPPGGVGARGWEGGTPGLKNNPWEEPDPHPHNIAGPFADGLAVRTGGLVALTPTA